MKKKNGKTSERPEEVAMQKLLAERLALSERINALYDQITELYTLPDMRANIGKCFKSQDSYGTPKTRWWVYEMIVGVIDGEYQVLYVENPSDGRVDIRCRTGGSVLTDTPISAEKFVQELLRAEYILNELVSHTSVPKKGGAK